MQKIHKQSKLLIGNIRITEMFFKTLLKKYKSNYYIQSIFQSQYKQY